MHMLLYDSPLLRNYHVRKTVSEQLVSLVCITRAFIGRFTGLSV